MINSKRMKFSLALRSDPPLADLNVRAGRLRVQEVIFSASGGKDSLIEPSTSGQLALFLYDFCPNYICQDDIIKFPTDLYSLCLLNNE